MNMHDFNAVIAAVIAQLHDAEDAASLAAERAALTSGALHAKGRAEGLRQARIILSAAAMDARQAALTVSSRLQE